MSRALIVLSSTAERERAAKWCRTAPSSTRVEFKEARRSLDQNAMLWASLTDVARQVEWHGVRLSPDDWKLVFLAALQTETRIVPNLDGTGFVNLSRSSDLSKAEFSDLIELILKFGAEHGVVFHDDKVEAA